VGTSVAFGLHVPYDEYFLNVAAPELSRMWHHPVEFQNLGDIGPTWFKSDLLLNEVVKLKPDAVIYLVVPFDLNRMDFIHTETPKNFMAPPPAKEAGWTWTDLRVEARESRVLIVAQHFLLRDEHFFLRAFENYADPFDVARQPAPPLVEMRFERMNTLVGKLADRMHAAKIPCFMIALPNRVECALISKKICLPHMDAYVFPRRMEVIARENGLDYIDMMPPIQKTPNAESMFYAVDGHPTGSAHALMARTVVEYFGRQSRLFRDKESTTTR
jgi:hypothetical protein